MYARFHAVFSHVIATADTSHAVEVGSMADLSCFGCFSAAFAGTGLAIKFTYSFLHVAFVTYFNPIHAVCT